MQTEAATTTTNPQLAALQASFDSEFNEPAESTAPTPKVKKSVKAEKSTVKQSLTVESAIEPEINLPRVQLELSDVVEYHQMPELLVERIQQQAGSFVFDVSISKGRDACRSHAANIIRCISPALAASKQIASDAKKVQEADLYFRKTIEKGIRAIADHTRAPLTEWEDEQRAIDNERKQQELQCKKAEDEQKLIDDEASKQAKNKAHRQRVNADILKRLLELGLTEDQSKLLIKSAVMGKLGALVVNYW